MKKETTPRPYRLGVRAESAEATYNGILDAFVARLGASWFEQVTLDAVAADAEVSVQTIVRRFGGKEGLLEAACHRLGQEITGRRATPAGDAEKAAEHLAADYEAVGDFVMRFLAQEDRSPAVRKFTDHGRAHHRQWLTEVFAPQLARWSGAELTTHLDLLVAATDLYVWKLVRRDMGRSSKKYRAILRHLIAGALAPMAAE